MFLKALIVILLVCVIASLFSGLYFLFKDTGRRNSKRTWYALRVRVVLASALLLTIFYGFYSGQLTMGASAPWHNFESRPLTP